MPRIPWIYRFIFFRTCSNATTVSSRIISRPRIPINRLTTCPNLSLNCSRLRTITYCCINKNCTFKISFLIMPVSISIFMVGVLAFLHLLAIECYSSNSSIGINLSNNPCIVQGRMRRHINTPNNFTCLRIKITRYNCRFSNLS